MKKKSFNNIYFQNLRLQREEYGRYGYDTQRAQRAREISGRYLDNIIHSPRFQEAQERPGEDTSNMLFSLQEYAQGKY